MQTAATCKAPATKKAASKRKRKPTPSNDKDDNANKDNEEDADGSDDPDTIHPRPSNLKVGRPPKRARSSSIKSEKGVDAPSYSGFAARGEHALPGPPSKEALSVEDFPNLEESNFFNPPCCHGCNNNSLKNGPCTCKLCEWGVSCANCVKSGKARCTFALNALEFLAATERTFAMNAAHPQNLRASLNRINFHLSSARYSFQLYVAQQRAAYEEFQKLVGAAKFIEATYPTMHAIGPCFQDEAALKKFAGFSMQDINKVLTILNELDLFSKPLAPFDHPPPFLHSLLERTADPIPTPASPAAIPQEGS
ncbi:hypothetical protein HYPSUDRAFT_210397 [Hypholoma sublateritium FD-334 SS-4]|uniref:Uncharacterized protein n=1 Tax=Hypholoma sublateritium (strain FD-334 SS-4) TaxID=945553 RepID=A0A0D2N010_HYPSF|nr:hypothetical protein HYPSUDRAFT_210397 [Hypholoma sublateritium FD-334 SS-4]